MPCRQATAKVARTVSDILELLAHPLWWERAACRGRLDLLDAFVPGIGGQRRQKGAGDELKAICGHCPVSSECLADVIAYDAQRRHNDGGRDRSIRAGLTPGQRVKLS